MTTISEKIEKIAEDIRTSSYLLTRDDIDSIEWRLNDIKKFILDIYKKRGKQNE